MAEPACGQLQQIACFHDETDSPERAKQVALYLRYQTTHDRNFHKCLNDLLKLRAEKRKQEIGFESQENRERERAERAHQQAEEHVRKQEAEKRRQELHKWKVLLAEAKVDQILLRNTNLQTSERRLATQSAA